MLDKIRWLHISDLHLKQQSASWSQDVVLRALHTAITNCAKTRPVRLVLATGDLSYSGKAKEFAQVERFFRAVLKELDLSPHDLFLVPGNHDNDLSVQKYSVAGVRATVTSSSLADELVGDAGERQQILARQRAYRQFLERLIPAGAWEPTPDGLAYTAVKSVSSLRLSIIGLNSAWLCQSGRRDRGNVVIGERQIIDSITTVQRQHPHFVLALIHHPTFWLSEFEHKAVEDRLRQACDFVLRGHLHETDIQTHIASDRRCMFVAAGASFETRESRNSFNYVELDIGEGLCTIIPFEYRPLKGEFVEVEAQTERLEFSRLPRPNGLALANALVHVAPELSGIASYLACLIRGDKSEFLAFEDGRPVFLTLDALEGDDARSLVRLTRSFITLRNLSAFTETAADLHSAFSTHRARLCDYGKWLITLAAKYPAVQAALDGREGEAKAYLRAVGVSAAHFTVEALRDLRRSDDLETLQRLSDLHVEDSRPEVRREARRGLAFLQARSAIATDRENAITLLHEVCDDPASEPEDFATLIQLLINFGRNESAKDRIRSAIRQFPHATDPFVELGLRVVELTGDRNFRDELLAHGRAAGANSHG